MLTNQHLRAIITKVETSTSFLEGITMENRFTTFTTTISLLQRYVQRIKSAEMSTVGLKGTHVMYLYNLGQQEEGLTASELCRLCGEDKAAISRATNELVEKGYIWVDARREKRAYRTKIHLTEKGIEALSFIEDRVNHVLDAVGEGMTEEKRQEFYQALAIISNNLKRYLDTELGEK